MPLSFAKSERIKLIAFLNFGKANAINAKQIALHMGYSIYNNQVKTRKPIRECIEHDNDIIASTLTNPRGFYKIKNNNIQELSHYLDSLENRARKINSRRSNLITNWNTKMSNKITTKQILPY